MSPSDARQGPARPSRQSCVGADGSLRGRSAFRAQIFARPVAFACVAAISILSLVPGAERPHTGMPGRAEHFIAYAGTGFFVALGYVGRRQRGVAWIGLAAASGLFELLQNFVPGRSPSFFDALASSGGLTCGMAVGALLTAALTWDRADGFLDADRGAAFWRSLPFRRRRRPEND
jgi:VanZ family protein